MGYKSKRKKVYITIVFFLLLSVGIGYSILTTDLSITGTAIAVSDTRLYAKVASASKGTFDNTSGTNITSSTGINFKSDPSTTNGQGVYKMASTANDTYPIYYYRGDVTNNNVLFANFCWKIVRTTSTGGVKLIYNGKPSSGKCSNTSGTGTQIGTSTFNSDGTSPSDVGYMYNTRTIPGTWSSISTGDKFANDITYDSNTKKYTLSTTYTMSSDWSTEYSTIGSKYHYTCWSSGTSCTSVYYIYYVTSERAKAIKLTNGDKIDDYLNDAVVNVDNSTDSTIKEKIDTWYESNMTSYTSKLEDVEWCNDRSIYIKNGWDKDTDATSWLFLRPRETNQVTYELSMSCANANDKFTTSTSTGNGDLTYPVGLLTADEVGLAGNGYRSSSTTRATKLNTYLYTGQNWWTMSPRSYNEAYAFSFYVNSYGRLDAQHPNVSGGIRPALSLKVGTTVTSGDGSASTPYVIS